MRFDFDPALMKMVLMLVSVSRLCVLACLLPLAAAAGMRQRRTGHHHRDEAAWSARLSWPRSIRCSFVAQRVAGDHATVASLTQPGAEPHDLELTPRQVASLTTASLVIYEKGLPAGGRRGRGAERQPGGDRYQHGRSAAAAGDDRR